MYSLLKSARAVVSSSGPTSSVAGRRSRSLSSSSRISMIALAKPSNEGRAVGPVHVVAVAGGRPPALASSVSYTRSESRRTAARPNACTVSLNTLRSSLMMSQQVDLQHLAERVDGVLHEPLAHRRA